MDDAVRSGYRCVVISGCSGGGKSTLLAALARRGYRVVDEPGRRIVQAEVASGGSALPWNDMPAFLHRAIALAEAERRALADASEWIFFDRSVVDAAAALEHYAQEPALLRYREAYRYHPQVFLTPPWPEIYQQDAERQHDFAAACAEYQRLVVAYPALGYQVTLLPTVSVAERVAFILAQLGRQRRDC